jgi:hypothetical protein
MSNFKSNELDEIFQKLTTNLGVQPGGTMHDAFWALADCKFLRRGL